MGQELFRWNEVAWSPVESSVIMEHIYPAFERGRIMKKELLWALRDYSYSALQLQYPNYPDGIISGCRIGVEENFLNIGPGIIKCNGFLFLMERQEQVAYTSSNQYVSLKFRMAKREELPDYTRYITEYILDRDMECTPSELEICRFKLREGARLRINYKDFFDIQTEYDTVNLADAVWAARDGNTLSKYITDYFAAKVLECDRAQEADMQFARMLLQSRDAVSRTVLDDYINRKTGNKTWKGPFRGKEAFDRLEGILEGIRSGRGSRESGKRTGNERMIILD